MIAVHVVVLLQIYTSALFFFFSNLRERGHPGFLITRGLGEGRKTRTHIRGARAAAIGAVQGAFSRHGSSPLHALEAASAFFAATRARRHPRGRPRRLVPLAPSRKQPRRAANAAVEASAWESGPTRAAATSRAAEAAAGRTKEAGHRPGGECPGRRYVRRDRPVAAQVRHRGRPQSLVDPRQVRYSRV